MRSSQVKAPACRILFVDDDPFYRDLASAALGSAHMSVTMAEDGDHAMQALAAASYDLMVLDLSMPGRTGFEIIEGLRRNTAHSDLPIVIITGNDDEATVARAFELGATSFQAKPLNWPLFVQHVRFVLESARVKADLRRAQRTAEFMSDLKSRLIGTLVTEFQAPLRSAFGFARLINQEADGPLASPLYTEWIGELHRSLERLSAVHLKMLNFGQSLSDQIELNEETAGMSQLIATCLDSVQDTARRRNIKLVIDDTLPTGLQMRVDSVLLSNALRSVADNAVKFSPRGSDVSVRVGLTGPSHLTISIDDATTPMPQHQIDEILGLKAFAAIRPESVELSTGLKMSRVLVEAHQGSLRMRANGQGMNTALVLPRERVVEAVSRPAVSLQAVPRPQRPSAIVPAALLRQRA
jgi:two-component system, sensor histidine kinase and response regulator